MKKWLVWTVVSIPIGFVLGFVMGLLWFFTRVIFLGYGDSGPSWIITVNHILFYGGLTAGILGGQILFFLRGRAESFARRLAKRNCPENTSTREKS